MEPRSAAPTTRPRRNAADTDPDHCREQQNDPPGARNNFEAIPRTQQIRLRRREERVDYRAVENSVAGRSRVFCSDEVRREALGTLTVLLKGYFHDFRRNIRYPLLSSNFFFLWELL